VGDVGVRATGVHHHEQLVGRILGDDQVVQDAAVGRGKHRIAGLALAQAEDVSRHQPLDRGGRIRAGDRDLAHVGNIEEASGRARVQMLVQDPAWILDGHIPAREWHHAGPKLAMQAVERSGLDRFGQRDLRQTQDRSRNPDRVHPLCPVPESLHGTAPGHPDTASLPFGGPHVAASLQSASVFCGPSA
jgi:hypothetical protein